MSYKMLVLDIDGTLTNSKKEITKRTKTALKRAQDKGVTLVIASGRPTQGIVPIAEELDMQNSGGYILSFNGAVVTDYKTKEVVCQTTLSKEELPRLYLSSKQYGIPIVSYSDGVIITESASDKYIEIEARINKMPVKQVEDFVSALNHDVPKCLMVGDGDYLATVEKEINNVYGQRLSIYRSEPFFLEIMPKNIDKANSLCALLSHAGLKREEMIACGDGYNDLSMIKYAGLGVAMGNAQPIVKESANHITLTNDEDGVAHVIEEFIL